MHKPTSGMLTDFANALWKQTDDCTSEELALRDVSIRTNEVVRLHVRDHGHIDHSKVMQPETYDLTFKYYLQGTQSEPIQGARSTLLPRSLYSLTFESKFGPEAFYDGHRQSEPGTVNHVGDTHLVTVTFRFQKRS